MKNQAWKFTFKRNPPTGRYRSFEQESQDIKIKGKIVGTINEQKGFSEWKVSFVIEDDIEKCGWRWIRLARKFTSWKTAREWCNLNFLNINQQFKLKQLD